MIAPQQHIPPQALGPLRDRLAVLRSHAGAELDPEARARIKRAAEHLETLIRQLEHGHAPT